MSITIKADLVAGESFTEGRAGTESYSRAVLIEGLSGTGHARLRAALAALDAVAGQGYKIGEAHPTESGVKLEKRTPEAQSPKVVRVRLDYQRPKGASVDENGNPLPGGGGGANPIVFEVGSSLAAEETNTDANGALITVTYGGQSQSGMLSCDRPVTTLRGSRIEYSSPGPKSRMFTGAINSVAPWFDPTAAAHTWKCMGIVGTSNDGGATYDVSYEFAYKADGWDQTVCYIDPATGRPPADVSVAGGSKKLVQLQPAENFNELKDWV